MIKARQNWLRSFSWMKNDIGTFRHPLTSTIRKWSNHAKNSTRCCSKWMAFSVGTSTLPRAEALIISAFLPPTSPRAKKIPSLLAVCRGSLSLRKPFIRMTSRSVQWKLTYHSTSHAMELLQRKSARSETWTSQSAFCSTTASMVAPRTKTKSSWRTLRWRLMPSIWRPNRHSSSTMITRNQRF